MIDRITLLNRALLRIGEAPLVTELDAGAPAHLAIYDSVAENLFAHPWSFAKQTLRLTRLTAGPVGQWSYAYQLPPDRLAPPRAVYPTSDTSRQPTTAYDLQGDQLLSDLDEIWIVYLRQVPPDRWPGDFREAFVTALRAELALSVREDRALHDRLHVMAYGTPQQMGVGGLVGKALDNDNQGIPATIVGGGYNPLIDVRF